MLWGGVGRYEFRLGFAFGRDFRLGFAFRGYTPLFFQRVRKLLKRNDLLFALFEE
jgi:hypothetical protein